MSVFKSRIVDYYHGFDACIQFTLAKNQNGEVLELNHEKHHLLGYLFAKDMNLREVLDDHNVALLSEKDKKLKMSVQQYSDELYNKMANLLQLTNDHPQRSLVIAAIENSLKDLQHILLV